MALHGMRILRAGYKPIPLTPGQKVPGMYSGGRWSPMQGWNEFAFKPVTADHVAEWSAWPGCGVGIIASGLSALDVDIKDEPLVAEIEEALRKEGVALPVAYRVGEAPKRLFLRRSTRKMKKYAIGRDFGGVKAKHLLEVLGDGQQFVVFNVHPGTGREYEWPRGDIFDRHISELPEASDVDEVKTIIIVARLMYGDTLNTVDGVASVDELISDTLAKFIADGGDAQVVRDVAARYGVKVGKLGFGTKPSQSEIERARYRAEMRGKYGPNSEKEIRDAAKKLIEANAKGALGGWDVLKMHVGYGLFDACRDLKNGAEVAHELFMRISEANAEKHNPQETDKFFRSFFTSPVNLVTQGSFFYHAIKHGWRREGQATLLSEAPEDKVIASERPSTLPAERLSTRAGQLITGYLMRAAKVAHNRRELARLTREEVAAINADQIAGRAKRIGDADGNRGTPESYRVTAAEELAANAQRRARARFLRVWGRRSLEPLRRALRGSAGGGKSTTTAMVLARYWDVFADLNVEIAVMTHAEAEKMLAELTANFATVNADRAVDGLEPLRPHLQVIYGRTSEMRGKCHPDRRPLVKQAEGKVASVFGTFCKGKDMSGNDAFCPKFDECEHVAQFAYKGPGVRIVVHQTLFTDAPDELKRPDPDIVIIDERFKAAALERVSVKVGRKAGAYTDTDDADGGVGDFDSQTNWFKEGSAYDPEALEMGVALGDALRGLPDGPLPMAVIKGIGSQELAHLTKAARLAADSHDASQFFNPSWGVERVAEHVEHLTTNRARVMQRALERMAEDLENLGDNAASNSLWIRGGELVLVSARKVKVPRQASVIYLDADGRHETAQRLLGDGLKTVKLSAERQGTVIQNYSDVGSKNYLTRKAGDLDGTRSRYEHLRDDELAARGFYDALADHVRRDVADGKKVLIAAAKRVRDAMMGYAEACGAKPGGSDDGDFNPSVSVDWLGARLTYMPVFIGSNDFRNFDVIHVVGREQPPVIEVEMTVGGLFHDEPSLKLTGTLEKRWRRIWVESGEAVYGEVDAHVDHRVQAELESIREDAIKQAIDRLRLLFDNPDRRHPPVVYVHTNLPLPGLSVTQLVSRDEMRSHGMSRWAYALQQNDGVLVLERGWLHRQSGWGINEYAVGGHLNDLLKPGNMPSDACKLTLLATTDGRGRHRAVDVLVSRAVMVETPELIPALVEDAYSRDGVEATVEWTRALEQAEEVFDVATGRPVGEVAAASEDPATALREGADALTVGGGALAVVVRAAASVEVGDGAGQGVVAARGAGGGLRGFAELHGLPTPDGEEVAPEALPEAPVALGEAGLVARLICSCLMLDLTAPGAVAVVAAGLDMSREVAKVTVVRARKKKAEVASMAALVGKPTHYVSTSGNRLPVRMSPQMVAKLQDGGLTVEAA